VNQLSLFEDVQEPIEDEWSDSGLPETTEPSGAQAEWWRCPSSDYNTDNPADCGLAGRCGQADCAYKQTGKPPNDWPMEKEQLQAKFVAFDLEIARPFDSGRPYGISCASTLTSDGHLLLWHGKEEASDATLPEQMNPQEVQELAGYLSEMQANGYTVVTFNGAGFDMSVLAEECLNEHWAQQVAQLTMEHIDIGFDMHCQMGYMTGLAKLSEGLGVGGKTEGMHGDLAPYVWNGLPGDADDETKASLLSLGVEPGSRAAQDLCLEYVGQDAKLTADVYTALLEKGLVYWRTQRGTQSRYPWTPETKDGRLLTVNEALLIPEPDTSWMSQPRSRESYLEWMQRTAERIDL